MKRFLCRIAAVLILVLSTAAAQAAGRPVSDLPERAGFLNAAWTWIVLHALPATPPGRTAVVEKAGCDIDPNGLLRCSPLASASTEAGCEMDPNGAR
ncbi:MAG TPA: hypothetical protein VKK31_24330 [Thermoanaerobaculia bacterium]|nr:hypothetical protein [Thermoanaerobaculia bacterium]